jgi:hypothetical protein
MFDIKSLEVGSVFYGVKSTNSSFSRYKIHQEIHGEDWFKYSEPLREYTAVQFTVLGLMIVTNEIVGEWVGVDENGEHDREFYVEETVGDRTDVCELSIFDTDTYFHTKEELNECIAQMKAQDRNLDMT